MDSQFWDVYRHLRSLIQKPDEALYIVHTAVGAISVNRFLYRAEAGFVVLPGFDENAKERTLGFSEQQLSTFPIEIRARSGILSEPIRLNSRVSEILA